MRFAHRRGPGDLHISRRRPGSEHAQSLSARSPGKDNDMLLYKIGKQESSLWLTSQVTMREGKLVYFHAASHLLINGD